MSKTVDNLREIIKITDGDWNGSALTLWDQFRALCDEYPGASFPRDVFENWLENLRDLAQEALSSIEVGEGK